MQNEFRVGPWLVQPSLDLISRDGMTVHLEPKVMEVLVCLAQRAGEPVRKEELLQSVWPATFVTDDVLKRCVFELRRVFDDDAREPRIIETIHKRGYRMIAAVEAISEEVAPSALGFSASPPVPSAERHSVGREKERAELVAAFDSVAGGRGVLVCVAGEPGIGKTTLVHDFLSDLQASGNSFRLAIGRCSQRLAGSEAYLPFLEALDSLLRSEGSGMRAKLTALAPSWYAQLFPPSENDPSDARLREYVRTTTQERVKRELTAFLYEITRHEPLVLFFDDVHWADPSTVDLLAHLATKFDAIRVLVVVTYRPSELMLSKHPFIEVKRDLQARGMVREVDVAFLGQGDVERYIAVEFPDNAFPRDFASVIHSRTEGNPLFMVDLLRYLLGRKVIVKAEGNGNWRLAESLPDLNRDFPQSVSSVIEHKIDQLSDRESDVLRAAAIQGYEFDSAALARALEAVAMEIEETLDRLERVHAFVKRMGEDELPSGAPTIRYRFVHVLYQNALETSMTPARRVILSAALARTLAALYGEKSSSIASQLGFLYVAAREPGPASNYFGLAAMNAQRIFANQEAVALARRGLALLGKTPDTPECTRKELDLQVTLAFSLLFTRGYGVKEVQESMAKARALCETLGDRVHLFPILFGLWIYCITAPELQVARRTAEQMLQIACDAQDPVQFLAAHTTLGIALQHLGEIAAAQKELDEALTYHEPAQHSRYLEFYRMEPGLNARSQSVRTLWMLGYPDQARCRSREAVLLARTIPSPPSLAFALMHAAFLCQHLRQPEKARQIAKECMAVCDEHGAAQERAWVTFAFGWAVAELGQVEEGISQIRAALDAQLSIGGQIARPQFLAFLAEIYWHRGRAEEGLKTVEEGLAVSKENRDSYYDAELFRLQGEFFKMQDKSEEAESCFHQALEIARKQAAKSLELRATASLARLWQRHGKRKEAQQWLGKIYAWFTEGFETADLKEAASLLNELS